MRSLTEIEQRTRDRRNGPLSTRLLRRLSRLSKTDKPLSGLLADVPRYHSTPETRVNCADDVKFDVVRKVAEIFKRLYDVVDIDGARVIFEDGWGLIRASNTQPGLVLRAEAKTPAGLARIKRALEAALQSFPQVGPVRW